ncbi:MAG: F0F1 ATP synthase subunit B [Rikenellaceae bacterium]|nr:F0F1 ATP synthase subunit B [Rikenellaceae bacterium]
MGLLQPESGLLFWMLIAFVVVFFLLSRFGFPAILRTIEQRKEYIDSSLASARAAESKLASLHEQGEAIIAAAEARRTEILDAAAAAREQLLSAARERAEEEEKRLMAEARHEAEAEREAILNDAKNQVVMLSVAIAEKLLRGQLDDRTSQTALAERLLDEMAAQQKSCKSCTQD